jgi:hypothetical protein
VPLRASSRAPSVGGGRPAGPSSRSTGPKSTPTCRRAPARLVASSVSRRRREAGRRRSTARPRERLRRREGEGDRGSSRSGAPALLLLRRDAAPHSCSCAVELPRGRRDPSSTPRRRAC